MYILVWPSGFYGFQLYSMSTVYFAKETLVYESYNIVFETWWVTDLLFECFLQRE